MGEFTSKHALELEQLKAAGSMKKLEKRRSSGISSQQKKSTDPGEFQASHIAWYALQNQSQTMSASGWLPFAHR
jgi:hypothetical protein